MRVSVRLAGKKPAPIKYILDFEDVTGSGRDLKSRFSSIEEAIDHVEMVLLRNIVDEMHSTLQQDDPSPWLGDMEEMKALADEVLKAKTAFDLENVIEEYNRLAASNYFDGAKMELIVV